MSAAFRPVDTGCNWTNSPDTVCGLHGVKHPRHIDVEPGTYAEENAQAATGS